MTIIKKNRVVEEAYLKIFQAKGVVVPNLGTRRGRRNDLGLGRLPRGGIMKKNKEFKKKWIHPDAITSYIEKMNLFHRNEDN